MIISLSHLFYHHLLTISYCCNISLSKALVLEGVDLPDPPAPEDEVPGLARDGANTGSPDDMGFIRRCESWDCEA